MNFSGCRLTVIHYGKCLFRYFVRNCVAYIAYVNRLCVSRHNLYGLRVERICCKSGYGVFITQQVSKVSC